MSEFTIREIENMCGIKAHTLRIWEQRYQIRCPRRKAGNHRLYDKEDLKYLLRIAFLYHNGHRISRLAQLSEEEISELALNIPQGGGANEIFINHLVEASLDFDQETFDRVLHNVILHMGFEKAITQVAYPFLMKIGVLWLTGHVIPAQEHFASALITKKLMVAINGLDSPVGRGPRDGSGGAPEGSGGPGGGAPEGRHILLYTPKGEMHEIPLLYMRYLMKKNAQSTVYFGASVCMEDLKYYCGQRPVTHLYFHLVTNLLRCEPDQYLSKLTECFPDKEIVISGSLGQAVQGNYPRIRILKGLEEMQEFARGK
jgi:MerR family transcriptional regulator, light-induced transcriptional regulator